MTHRISDCMATLSGKVAIVTGGSRGVGAGVAVELASRGADVLITYNSNPNAGDEIVKKIESIGQKAIAVQAKGTDLEAPESVIRSAVENWGKIDIIINNAAFGDDCWIQDVTQEFWINSFDCNVRFPFFLVKAALPYLGAAPRIVSVSSIAARNGPACMGVYSATKAALESLTRTWATELGKEYNLTANSVNPGPIATDMWFKEADQAVRDEWGTKAKETPAAPRIGNVDDIVQIIAFLSEEKSRWCTGSTVCANGGLFFN